MDYTLKKSELRIPYLLVSGYWIITKNKEEADFILKFNIRFAGLGDAFGSAQFIYPKNDIKNNKRSKYNYGLGF